MIMFFFGAAENYLPKINIGILTICLYENGRIHWPGGGSHPTLDKRVPVILDSKEHLYFWTRHYHQDTNSIAKHDYIDSKYNFNKLSEDIIERNFPIIYQHHKKEVKSHSLVHIKGGLYKFNNVGPVKLRINYICDDPIDVSKIKPLVSFKFKDEDLTLIEKMDFNRLGLMKSLNKSYGFYRYLIFDSPQGYVDLFINIPREITDIILEFFNRGAKIRIISIDVFQSVV